MLRTLVVRFSARSASTAIGFLFWFGFAATAGEMTSSLQIGNARIDIVIEHTSLHVPMKDIFLWVKAAAESVTTYYGRFPVPEVLIRITPFKGRGTRDGMTFGDRGGRITIGIGNDTSPSEFAADWMLTHEMVHLAFPSVDEKHHWIEEGIATYVEPIARIRAGHLTAGQMWLDLVRGHAPGAASGRRSRARSHAHLGENLLGRSAVLPAG
jgi:hypothetical protein